MLTSEPSNASTLVPEKRLAWRQTAAVWALIVGVAGAGLCTFYRLGVTDILGDALAHMEGARRLIDSLTPGYAEIGSVWLPLYHIIVSPLAQNNFLWRTGLAGSLVSIACFVVTCWLLFRMAMEMNSNISAGLVALAGILLCPSMIYLASEPMTEAMAQLWAVLAVYGLFRYQWSGSTRTLVLAALAAFGGTLTRYGEWYVLPFAALFVFLSRRENWKDRFRHTILFSLIAGAGPVLWFLHNAYRFGNPLEFYNGPYSALAIYAHQVATTGFRYPTDGSVLISARYYLEDLTLVIGAWSLELAAFGLLAWLAGKGRRARGSAALLLLVPLPFYIQAMAHAAVGLYVPTYFPYTYYNLRYGLEMLPAIALLPSFAVSARLSRHSRWLCAGAMIAAFTIQSALQIRSGLRNLPIVRESILNTPCGQKPEEAAVRFLKGHYDGQRVLMAAGMWPCVAPRVGIDYRNILTQYNRRYWNQLPSGAGKWVEWIIRGDGDEVDQLMRAYPSAFQEFVCVKSIPGPEEGSVSIYRRAGP